MDKPQFNIIRLEQAGSTNDEAKLLAVKGAPEGTVVTARQQTAGRGRRGSLWQSEPGLGLCASVIVRPMGGPKQAALLPVMTACAAARAIERVLERAGAPGIAAGIKWPNDILIDGRKVCGILVETGVCEGAVEYAVAGVGVNVNQDGFGAQLMDKACSLYMACGRLIDVESVLQALLMEFGALYPGLADGEFLNDYRARCVNIGRAVKASDGLMGTAAAVNSDGELVVATDDGLYVTLRCGEVSVRGENGYF